MFFKHEDLHLNHQHSSDTQKARLGCVLCACNLSIGGQRQAVLESLIASHPSKTQNKNPTIVPLQFTVVPYLKSSIVTATNAAILLGFPNAKADS